MEKKNAALPRIPIKMPSERQNAQKGIIANKLPLMSGFRKTSGARWRRNSRERKRLDSLTHVSSIYRLAARFAC